MIDYNELAGMLVEKCVKANCEIAVATRIEDTIRDILKVQGVEYQPIRENRVINLGRAKSQFGAIVTEYKQNITGEAEWHNVTNQLVELIEDKAPDPHTRDKYLGIVTDGCQIRFILFDEGIAKPESPTALDGFRLRRWTDSLIGLQRRGLTADNLVDDFAVVDVAPDGVGRRLAIACYNTLKQPTHKTGMLHKEWRRLFAQSVDHRRVPEAHVEAYRKALGLDSEDPIEHTRCLFALQTAYAIIVKLVALKVLLDLRSETPIIQFHELASLGPEGLLEEMQLMEDGHLLRDLHINNLLEGDFFAWYVDSNQWNGELYEAILEVIMTLSDYEGRGPVLKPGVMNDIFRKLYQRTIPAEVRHDLGEYYTPRWLAQAVIERVPKPSGWRGLDPCCGSGTFLIEMIALVMQEVKDETPEKQLQAITTRVKGFDLNPLAVLTSRVNYLLALSPLLGSVEHRLEIPVYLGDAAYIPKLTDLGGVDALEYQLNTDVGRFGFTLPLSLAEKPSEFGAAMLEVERGVINQDSLYARAALLDVMDEDIHNPAIVDSVETLIQDLIELEAKGWNRIWGRLIKNFLATAAIGTFQCVAGNPPWVEWKDLPNGYRETIKDLCRQRGLFSDDQYTGGTDLNISALIAHTVLEQWVSPGGYLSFLMPKSLLQIRSTQGFRRWTLPDGTHISLQQLDDWSALEPFEGAVTNPVGYLFQKSGPKKKLVPMTVYRCSGRIECPHDAVWCHVEGLLEKQSLLAAQVGDDGHPYLIDEASVLPSMFEILGKPAYRGRRATETSPHSIFWLRYLEQDRTGVVLVENDINPRARNRVPRRKVLLETEHLYPTLQGRHIHSFRVSVPEHVILLPHTRETEQHAIPENTLRKKAELTYRYLSSYESELGKRGSREKYRGEAPFYALWRVGPYTFAPYKVVWPEIGELRAAVISTAQTPWGEEKMIVPEGKINLIACDTKEEAHFICGFLNTPLVQRAYAKMSSAIGRPVRLPFAIPRYDKVSWTHRAMTAVSRAAHQGVMEDPTRVLSWLLERIY